MSSFNLVSKIINGEVSLSHISSLVNQVAANSKLNRAKVGAALFDLSKFRAHSIHNNNVPHWEPAGAVEYYDPLAFKEKTLISSPQIRHAEYNVIMDFLISGDEELKMKAPFGLWCNYSSCEHCANVIIDSRAVRLFIFEEMYRITDGLFRLLNSNITVLQYKDDKYTQITIDYLESLGHNNPANRQLDGSFSSVQ